MNSNKLECFKAYDVRGRIPDELNSDIAYKIGRAYAQVITPNKVVVGHDIRLTSPELSDALIKGLIDSGVDVVHIGQCGTEQIYFTTFDLELDGGIMITASHNPKDYNGMKFVSANAKPISGDTGLTELHDLVVKNKFDTPNGQGSIAYNDHTASYVSHLLNYISTNQLKPLKLVVDPGNGGAGRIIELLENFLPFEFVKVNFKADGNFPNGIPNPLLPENRNYTAQAVIENNADMGIAWDGDFDRCFFFDEKGRFIEGYYIVGLLAEAFLKKEKGGKIIHDPRLTWNTISVVKKEHGIPIQSKTGHAFIKERMRKENAVYGGEMSSHHYFKEFAYCDSGMIPWLLVAELLCIKNQPLSALVNKALQAYPTSGEINRRVSDVSSCLDSILTCYIDKAELVDKTDGISLEFKDWRFNLRASNTEPLLRLNVESRSDANLMILETKKLLQKIDVFSV
ncbi:phosphomannomutase [Halodesulfovibrio aestuarii]|uniref:phosphomannomutase n=1 Tax=Halodesulfovibrio aestuarii TaxID=126333 RepID=UPI003D3558F8